MNRTQSTTLRDALEKMMAVKISEEPEWDAYECNGDMWKAYIKRIATAALAAADATDQGQGAEDSTDSRARFESWCKSSGMFTDWTRDGITGEYQKPRVVLSWQAWQAARPAPIGAVAPDAILAACYRVDWTSNEPAGAMLLAAMKEEIADLRAALKAAAAPAAPIAEVATWPDTPTQLERHEQGIAALMASADRFGKPPPSLLDTIERERVAVGKPSHEQAMRGYEVACKFGVLEARAFKLVDEMFAALGQQSIAVDGAPSTGSAAGWISVDDRLPEEGVGVMVYSPPLPGEGPEDYRLDFDCIDPNDDDHASWLNHNENYEHFCCVAKPEGSTGPREKAPYTHWQPLPAAPTMQQPATQTEKEST